MKIAGVYKSNIMKFNTHSVASNVASQDNAQGHSRGMFHGDDGLYWVVSGRDIKKLRDAGYEQIN